MLLGACTSLQPAPAVRPALAKQALSGWARADAAHALPTAPDDTALATWWQQFNDPGLDALMRDALAANRDLKGAQASLRQAQAARALAESALFPTLGVSAGSSRSMTRSSAGNLHKLGFSASWEPDLSGTQAAGASAAEADLDAARADLATTRMALAAELGLAYAQWRGAQARERITRDSLASLEQTLQLAQWKTQAGLASSLDVEQARLSAEQTRASLPSLATEVAQYEHQIAVLTGQTPAQWRQGSVAPTAGDVPQADAALQQLAVGLPADLLRRRPDLRAAEAQVRAAWARKEQTRRAGFPRISLAGSVGLQAATLAALGSAGAGLATLAASVDWTLFDAGARQAQVDQQDALLELSRASYDSAVLLAVKDVEDGLAALEGSRQRAQALRQATDAASNALLLTRAQHQAGLTDFATLLEAQRNELNARLSLQSTQTDVSLTLIRVYKALGGGWSRDELTTAAAGRPD
jgi:NodT family efflux transporter outer membrane factor (OMF) lipoprotein